MGRLDLADAALRLNATGHNYYIWLLDKIRIREHPENRMMCEYLFDYPFKWSVDNDVNRAKDGMLLREQFEEETGYPISEYKEVGLNVPCSVLEMLIGLAQAIEDNVMYDPDFGNRLHMWFWIMVDNVGLTKATDDEIEFGSRFGVPYMDYILDNWLERRFEFDGTGSIFPLKLAENDQRSVELWYQCLAYLGENYRFF
jgi:hypothetical protein